MMTLLLQEVASNGTASRLTIRKKLDVAVKTGTTQSECDRWLIGYTPYYLGSVWVGYSMPQPLDNFETNPVISAWDGVMTAVHQHIFEEAERTGEPIAEFEKNSSIIQMEYCADSGKLATENCRLDPRGNRILTGYFFASDMPDEECDVHVAVDYDAVSGGIATPYCPEENLITVGLLNIQRSFPCQVKITDAEYTYWDLEALGIAPGGTESDPFFVTALPENTYAGISHGTGQPQYNRLCQEHQAPPETTAPETTLPPDTLIPDTLLPGETKDPEGGDDPENGNNPETTTGPPDPDPDPEPSPG